MLPFTSIQLYVLVLEKQNYFLFTLTGFLEVFDTFFPSPKALLSKNLSYGHSSFLVRNDSLPFFHNSSLLLNPVEQSQQI